MKIAFDTNSVLRDVFLKAEQIYTKNFMENEINEEIISEYDEESDEWLKTKSDKFKYELNLPVTSLELINHFKFKDKDELFNFFYVDFPMEIFGHSPSMSHNTFNVLNDLYEKLRDENDVLIISDEIHKSKPATLFFLSKYGCLIEKIIFYSNITMDSLWNEFDVLVTANPTLLDNTKNKTIIKLNTTYNEDSIYDYAIDSIEELYDVFKDLKLM